MVVQNSINKKGPKGSININCPDRLEMRNMQPTITRSDIEKKVKPRNKISSSNTVRIVVVGDSKSGKSSLINTFAMGSKSFSSGKFMQGVDDIVTVNINGDRKMTV